jgi:hypothetical protein
MGDAVKVRPQECPTAQRCRRLLTLYRATGRKPTRWLLSARVARLLVEELRPMLQGEARESATVEDLTQFFGLPVELVTDLPQGAVLR